MNSKKHIPALNAGTKVLPEDTPVPNQCQPAVTVALCSSNGTKLKAYNGSRRHLEMENFDLIAKVLELLNTHNLWGPDGTYTFEDGERWAKLEGEDK